MRVHVGVHFDRHVRSAGIAGRLHRAQQRSAAAGVVNRPRVGRCHVRIRRGLRGVEMGIMRAGIAQRRIPCTRIAETRVVR